MGVTFYSQIDLINKQVLGNSFINASNIGVDPSINVSGSLIDNAFSMAPASPTKAENTQFGYELLYDVNHSSPPGPVPTNARITKVIIQMQVGVSPSAAGSASITFPGGGSPPGGTAAAQASLGATVEILGSDLSLGTLTQISTNVFNTGHSGTGASNATASSTPAGTIIGFSIDYTTNPGGMYPSLYQTYAQFLTQYANILFDFSGFGGGQATWLASSGQSGNATGSVTGSISLVVNNFSMEVDWFVPSSWVMTPSSLTLPTNIVTLTRPDPHIPPDQDPENLSALTVNGVTITPTSFNVILWLRFLIIFTLTPDLIPDTPSPITLPVSGTEFSGSVLLGTLTVTTADLSGIYTFDTTVHHDQLYARSTSSTTVTTQNVMIPSPMFVTAFFNDDEEEIMHFTGFRMRIYGNGVRHASMQSLDAMNTQQLADFTMSMPARIEPFTLANFIDQRAAIRMWTSSTDDYMVVSKIIMYLNPIYSGYPQ